MIRFCETRKRSSVCQKLCKSWKKNTVRNRNLWRTSRNGSSKTLCSRKNWSLTSHPIIRILISTKINCSQSKRTRNTKPSTQRSLIERKNADIEEQLIEFMEEESVLREEKEIWRTFQKIRNIWSGKSKIDKQVAELQKKVDELETEKLKLSKEIPDLLFRRYQRLIQHGQGKAVVTLSKGTCTGCHFRVRPQIMVEVSNNDRIITCENCSRILIAPE